MPFSSVSERTTITHSSGDVGLGADPEANKALYDKWGDSYTEDVRNWGYNMPEKMAEFVKSKVPFAPREIRAKFWE